MCIGETKTTTKTVKTERFILDRALFKIAFFFIFFIFHFNLGIADGKVIRLEKIIEILMSTMNYLRRAAVGGWAGE